MPQVLGKQQSALLLELQRLQEVSAISCTWTMEDVRAIGISIGMVKSSSRDASGALIRKNLLVPDGNKFRLSGKRGDELNESERNEQYPSG